MRALWLAVCALLLVTSTAGLDLSERAPFTQGRFAAVANGRASLLSSLAFWQSSADEGDVTAAARAGSSLDLTRLQALLHAPASSPQDSSSSSGVSNTGRRGTERGSGSGSRTSSSSSSSSRVSTGSSSSSSSRDSMGNMESSRVNPIRARMALQQPTHTASPPRLNFSAQAISAPALSRQPPDPAQSAALRAKANLAWPKTCPGWMKIYAEFQDHLLPQMFGGAAAGGTETPGMGAETAGATGAVRSAGRMPVKVMLHECVDEHTLGGCPGIGDRVRGLMETFKLAVYAGRAFLLRWEASAPLEDVLQPALLDWRVKPQYNIDSITNKTWYHWRHPEIRPVDITSGSYASKPDELISLTHGFQDCLGTFPGPDIGCVYAVPPHLHACVFHTLFKPSDKLAANIASLRRTLFGSETARYVAVHLRIGGFEGERKEVRGGLSFGSHSSVEVVANTLRSAQMLALASGIDAPILVLTDNDDLRDRLHKGELPGFVSPGYKAKHAAMARGAQHREAVFTSFSDLGLLAQAECFIGSPSGFTMIALMWGRHRCYLVVGGDGDGGVGAPWG